MNIFELAERNQAVAWKIIEETNIIEIWKSIGAEINLVGSLKSGLLMKNRDIDFHIYTDKLIIFDSFTAMEKLAENPSIKEISYKNLIHTEEECMEWHAWYETPEKRMWQLDLIHIRKGSAFDGIAERMTNAIREKLTPEIKEKILRIKNDTPENRKIPGIAIYQAVFSHEIETYAQFERWYNKNNLRNGGEWLP